MNLRARFALLISLFLIAFFVYYLTSKPQLNGEYASFGVPIPTSYPLLGIDVSHYQGNINWQQVKNTKHNQDSIQFIFIKASEGVTLKDDQLDNNTAGAEQVGLDFGCYHFFIPSVGAKAQAAFFCQNIQEKKYSLKPVLDLEFDGDFTNDRLQDSIMVFLNEVELRIGDRPILYTYSNFYKTHDLKDLANELFWIAQYGVHCDLMKQDNVQAWQFSEKGTVSGIEGYVDLNLGKSSFFNLLKKK
ncbi:MAG: GH25 family lysozyme [Crocinitomicaceae bacterium]